MRACTTNDDTRLASRRHARRLPPPLAARFVLTLACAAVSACVACHASCVFLPAVSWHGDRAARVEGGLALGGRRRLVAEALTAPRRAEATMGGSVEDPGEDLEAWTRAMEGKPRRRDASATRRVPTTEPRDAAAAAPALRRPPKQPARRRKGRKEVDYDALVGPATNDDIVVKMPKSPGDDGDVPSWHPRRKRRMAGK